MNFIIILNKKRCSAKAKLDIITNEFIVYIKSDKIINHENNTYYNFEIIIDNGKIESININLKCNQKYYIRYLYKKRIISDKISSLKKLKNKFVKDATIKFKDNDINKEKRTMYSDIKEGNILSLIKSLNTEIKDIIIKTYDINYKKQSK